MGKIISLKEYKEKKDKKTNKEGPFTLDELMVKFDEVGGDQKLGYLLDHEEIEQLLLNLKESDPPF